MFIAKTYGDGSTYNEQDIYGPEPSVFDFDIGSTGAGMLDDPAPLAPVYTDSEWVITYIVVTEPYIAGQVGQRPSSAIFDTNIFDSNIFA